MAASASIGNTPLREGPRPTAPALPASTQWLFVVAAPFLAHLFDPDCATNAGAVGRAMLALSVYTIVTGLAVHHGFEWSHRRLATRSAWVRFPVHLMVTTGLVLALSVPLLPIATAIYPEVAGDELTVISRALLVSFAYLGFAAFVGHLRRQAVRERTIALEARLATLRAQMQPHFLFNSLNVCAGLVHDRPDVAEETLDRLAGFLRYTLESTEQRLVPLAHELEAVRSYLEIQRSRFGDRLEFEIECDEGPSMERWSVPPMVLQPLVENAVLHGLRENGGAVLVRAAIRDGSLELTVEDDGVGAGRSTHHGAGVGQKNVRERLELIYRGRALLEVGPRSPQGYRCTLRIPSSR